MNAAASFRKGIKVFQNPVVANHAAESSKKCFHCGLMNFANQARCTRCRYDVWVSLTEPKNNGHLFDNLREFREFGRLKVSEFGRLKVSVLICAVLLSGLVVFFISQDSKETPAAVSVARPATQQAEQPGLVIAQENPQSQDAAKRVLAGLKLFHGATERSTSSEEYDEMLTRLKADVHKTLPSFVDHSPGAEFFRREVEAAVRDYTAAGSWWKTAERNSTVLTDADRNERLVASWTSAKTHLDNAEQMLVR